MYMSHLHMLSSIQSLFAILYLAAVLYSYKRQHMAMDGFPQISPCVEVCEYIAASSGLGYFQIQSECNYVKLLLYEI